MAAPQQARGVGVLPSCLRFPFVPMAAQLSLVVIKRGRTVLYLPCDGICGRASSYVTLAEAALQVYCSRPCDKHRIQVSL